MNAVLALVGAVPWGVLVGAAVVVGALAVAGGRQQVAQFAIMAAFKAGRDLVGLGLENVTDDELASVAHAAYGALPSVVLVGAVPVPVGMVKMFLTEDRFVALVRKEYHRFRLAYARAITPVPTASGPWGGRLGSPLRDQVQAIRADATVRAMAAARGTTRAAPGPVNVVGAPAPTAAGGGGAMLAAIETRHAAIVGTQASPPVAPAPARDEVPPVAEVAAAGAGEGGK